MVLIHQHCFIFHWRNVIQRSMQPFLIIHLLNEVWKPSENVVQGSVFPEIDFLGLYGFHEAFGKSVIVRIASPGHADPEPVISKFVDIIMGCVLHSLV